MRRRKCGLFLACLLLGTASSVWAMPRTNGLDTYPRAAVAYAVVVDGELLWGRHLDPRRAPASLTKLLTAMVLLDSDWLPDAVL